MITYILNKELNLAKWVIVDNVSVDEIIKKIEMMVNEEGYVPGMNLLMDNRKIKTVFSTGDGDKLANASIKYFGKLETKIKCASVFNTDIHYAIGRQYSIFSEKTPVKFRPFRHMEEAQKWLEDCSIKE